MTTRLVRAPNNIVSIGSAIALLLLAFAKLEALNGNDYRIPVGMLATPVLVNFILGIVLLFVSLNRSKFAGATAVVIATFLLFGVAFTLVPNVAFGLPYHPSWWTGINLVIAATLLWPLLFPWNWDANRPTLIWMGATFMTLTVLMGSAAIFARL